jgi:hypothetical protein
MHEKMDTSKKSSKWTNLISRNLPHFHGIEAIVQDDGTIAINFDSVFSLLATEKPTLKKYNVQRQFQNYSNGGSWHDYEWHVTLMAVVRFAFHHCDDFHVCEMMCHDLVNFCMNVANYEIEYLAYDGIVMGFVKTYLKNITPYFDFLYGVCEEDMVAWLQLDSVYHLLRKDTKPVKKYNMHRQIANHRFGIRKCGSKYSLSLLSLLRYLFYHQDHYELCYNISHDVLARLLAHAGIYYQKPIFVPAQTDLEDLQAAMSKRYKEPIMDLTI